MAGLATYLPETMRSRILASTFKGDSAADLLQVQRNMVIEQL
jgi:hypothetical protein